MASLPPAQPRRSNAIWWILGILVGGIVVLVALGLLAASLFIRHVNVSESGKKLEIETAAGTLRVKGNENHPTGLPIYPGAIPTDFKGTSVEFLTQNGSGGGLEAENYETGDDLEKVTAWYAQTLGPKFHREDDVKKSSSKHIEHVSDADVAFEYESDDGTRIVALKKKSPGVDITLFRAGKKEIQ